MISRNQPHIGQQIISACEDHRISLKSLQEEMRVTKREFEQWLSEERKPTQPTIDRLNQTIRGLGLVAHSTPAEHQQPPPALVPQGLFIEGDPETIATALISFAQQWQRTALGLVDETEGQQDTPLMDQLVVYRASREALIHRPRKDGISSAFYFEDGTVIPRMTGHRLIVQQKIVLLERDAEGKEYYGA